MFSRIRQTRREWNGVEPRGSSGSGRDGSLSRPFRSHLSSITWAVSSTAGRQQVARRLSVYWEVEMRGRNESL